MKRRADANQRCSACGGRLDSSYIFHRDRAGHSYCCACYLTHDTSGRRFGAGAEVLRVMTPAGMRAPWKDETAHAQTTMAGAQVTAEPPSPTGDAPLPAESGDRNTAPASRQEDQEPAPGGLLKKRVEQIVSATVADAAGRRVPARTALTPFNAPQLGPLRCALACGHAARRVYEHCRNDDQRLRPALVIVSEVAAGGVVAARRATTGRCVAALRLLGVAAGAADDPLLTACIAAVVDAMDAALAVLRWQPWRTVDRHAYAAFVRTSEAVRLALGNPSLARGALAALEGQHTRAFRQVATIWPAEHGAVAAPITAPAVHGTPRRHFDGAPGVRAWP